MIEKLSPAGFASLVLLCIITWAISHSYVGLFHDAALYTLQALARSDPTSLPRDVFLRFGSQDRLTVFSSIYAGAANAWGIERSAAILTLTFQLALIGSAWCLARAVTGSSLALLGLAIFIAVPAQYGADRVFTCIEAFITPRMASEAMVLASIACALYSARYWACFFLAAAIALHPIMGAAGLAALGWLYIGLPRPKLAVFIISLVTALLIAASALMPAGQWGRFDPVWLELVDKRSPYLFLAHWNLDDWSRALVSITTLAAGAWLLPVSKARSLSLVALLTVLSGLALAMLACDGLHLAFFAQLQSWRWQWLASIAAALLLPTLIESRWRAPPSGPAASLLLVSAWVFGSGEYCMIALASFVLLEVSSKKLEPNHTTLLFLGACGMLTISMLWRVASDLEFTESHFLDTHLPLAYKRLIGFCRDGLAPVTTIVLAWLLMRYKPRLASIVIGSVSTAAAALVLPTLAEPWFEQEFSSEGISQYAAWRAQIPINAEVLSIQSPLLAWVLLGRPNYISVAQSSGMVFSRNTAIELARRAELLKQFIPPESILDWTAGGTFAARSIQQLRGICDSGTIDYLVTGAILDRDLVAVQPGKLPGDAKALKLYRCTRGARTVHDL